MKEQTPNYSNKAEPQTVIRHKDCHTLVVRIAGSRLWCEKCQDYVDASQCYHEAHSNPPTTKDESA